MDECYVRQSRTGSGWTVETQFDVLCWRYTRWGARRYAKKWVKRGGFSHEYYRSEDK